MYAPLPKISRRPTVPEDQPTILTHRVEEVEQRPPRQSLISLVSDVEREKRESERRSQEAASRRTVETEQKETYSVGIMFYLFVIAQIIINIIELAQYGNAEQTEEVQLFTSQQEIVILFSVIGVTLHYAFIGKFKREKYDSVSIFKMILYAFILPILQAITRGLVGMKASVAPIDYFLLFLSLAVAEELAWRVFVLALIKKLLMYIKVKYIDIISSVIAIALSAIGFTYMHIWKYTSSEELWMLLVTGVFLGWVFLYGTKKRFMEASILCHLVLNIFAGINFVMTYYGGF